ncbi:PilC/PilY family type IV pilus protein [Motiliproteus sediminis]|uniref:PilC/PilY family type IV pilus protein n=1 Tax=Motiliproteus sediminis TaxID=1468178 RepID=UPI001AF01EFE|nr:PilC/PilY family type IV pilus protein [Motiliproteus sediminis]
MNSFKTRTKVVIGSFLSTWLVCTPAWADDTEIYFGGSTNIAVRPNVLFILDTSGSMDGYDGGSVTRLDRMKQALTNVLNTSTDINVGLMRFTNPGGPVLYPVRYIDEVVSTAGASTPSGTIVSQITNGSDDAIERSDGTTLIDGAVLETIQPTTTTVFEKFISNGDDDAEQNLGNNNVSTGSSDLELMHDGSTEQLVGLRLRNVDIPKNASIVNAYLRFEIEDYDNGDLSARIWGEAEDDPRRFRSNKNNISKRARSSASVDWSITDAPAANDYLYTPDISTIVQETVNRSGWVANNSMAFILEHVSGPSGNRRVVTSYNDESDAVKLHVEYSSGLGGGTAQTIGLRFNEIMVPQGATITSATLSMTAESNNAASATLTFQGEAADQSAPFEEANGNISGRSKTSATVGWTGAPAFNANSTYTSPDLTSIVQEIVNRGGWCGGNSLSLFITGNELRDLKSFENNIDETATLNITYNTATVPNGACVYNQYAANIVHGNDDAEQDGSSMDLDSTDLDLGDKIIGLRYQNLPLIQGAQITNAYIEFTADETDSGTANYTIYGHNSGDSGAFTTATNNISNRSKTTASVSWSPETWNSVGGQYRSPNIAPILQEIIARGDWSAGNALGLVIEGSGDRVAESYDGSTLPPRLVYYAKASDINNSTNTVRSELIQAISGLPHDGWTPIVDTLYEAARYYRGEQVLYGASRNGSGTRLSHPDSYTEGAGFSRSPAGCEESGAGSCSSEAITGTATYVSPIEESCQANYIVLLTDGEANNNHSADLIKAMTGDASCVGGSADQACGIELIKYLKSNDQDGNLAQDQTIKTYTVGLEFSTTWLQDLADAGGGSFYLAESAQDLTNTFDTIIKTIKAANSTFVEPSVTINQFNRFAHRDDVYFALFKPQETAKWYGNLKKYQLKGSPAELYDNRNPQQLAVDPDTGFFGINSQSFWSLDEDGNQVEKGGAASMQTVSRNIYTNVSGAVLSATENQLHESNTLVTDALLDIVGQTAQYREDLIKWARGLDVNGAPRKQLGDPLHSRPELVTYDGFSNPIESTIFFGTNEGYLHAVNINTGQEQFAFVPKELLGNLNTFYTNNVVDPRPYGLDGGITLWTKDINGDGDLKDTGEFAYLYVGMRRGGRSYYALDVTDVNNPELMWQIDGGNGDFTDLGQTWSKPIKTRIRLNNVKRDVLVFAGGYDTNQDNVSTRTADSFGNAVFMVDAVTGAKIWSAGGDNSHDEVVGDMDYSIPSEVKVIDINRDGFVDQMYVGDMGGQIWRFDVDNEQSQPQHLVDVTKIAVLADNTEAGNRRFYYPPDIALAVEGKDRYLALGVGSGYRAHPLNQVIEDRFYMIKLFDVYEKPSSFTPLTENDLYDATDNHIQQGDATQKAAAELALSNNYVGRKQGWMLRMTNPGEKVLAGSATIQNQIIFTTYEPTPPNSGSCNPAQGTSRAYLVSLFNATPMLDINKDGTTNKDDRVIQLAIGSIPASPTVIDTVDSKPTVWVGPERLDEVDTDVESIRTYWIEVVNP